MSITAPGRKPENKELVLGMTNKYGLPLPIALAIANDEYTKGKSDFSATELLQPPQVRALRIKHGHKVTEDVSDRIWSTFGTAIHLLIENATIRFNKKEAKTILVPEERYYSNINVDGKDYLISGQIDLLETDTGMLTDYKTTSVWSIIFGGKDEWVQQLNICAWLAKKNDVTINKLQIVAILRDWVKSKVGTNNYPDIPVSVVPYAVWPDKKVEKFIADRIRLHAADKPRKCTEEERWASETTYAIKKVGRKTAVKVFNQKNSADPQGAANTMAATSSMFSVEVRPGMNRRCEGYCEIAPFCKQFKKIKQAN